MNSNEVDEIINLMRKSKLADVRAFLEKMVIRANKGSDYADNFLTDIKDMFETCSKTE